MSHFIQIQLKPEDVQQEHIIRKLLAEKLELPSSEFDFIWHKRSIDARNRNIKINASFEIFSKNEVRAEKPIFWTEQKVSGCT
jgi:uncharacterized protein